jgi:orotate phosphoribosyltransferase
MTAFNPKNFDPKTGQPQKPPTKEEMFRMFRDRLLQNLQTDAYRKGEYTLSSGKKTDHYVNCKPVTLSGEGSILVGTLLLDLVEDETLAVAGLTLGADPLVTSVAMTSWLDNTRRTKLNSLIIRKEPKGHGTTSQIEGMLPIKGCKIVVLEDVVTTGESAMKAVRVLREAGYKVEQVISIVDRQEDDEADNLFEKENIEFVSLFTLDDISY